MTEARWLTIAVELLSGRGLVLDRPAGRVLLASPAHTLAELAEAIDLAFGRWDLAHLHQFELPDGRQFMLGGDDFLGEIPDTAEVTLGSLGLEGGATFEYVFDLGDDWTHRCEVRAVGVDPNEEYGEPPPQPVPVWGWGWIPDQYGRNAESE